MGMMVHVKFFYRHNDDNQYSWPLYRKIDKYLQSRETLASEDCLLEMSGRYEVKILDNLIINVM